MKKLLPVAFAAAATSLRADTITWTGGGETTEWATAANWDKGQVPGVSDDVEIGENMTVEFSGNLPLPKSLKMGEGTTVNATGEIWIHNCGTNDDPVYPAVSGGTLVGSMVAIQANGAYLTAEDVAIVITGTGWNGFYQNGGWLDIVTGDRKGSFTYQTSINANPFYFFSHNGDGATDKLPYIKLDGKVIDEETFEETFNYSVDGNTTTLVFAPVSDWRIVASGVSDIGETTATLNATVKKVGAEASYVYYACATSQSAVERALSSVALLTCYSETPMKKDDVASVDLTELAADTTYYYAFALVSGGKVVATTPVSSFTPTAYDNIYENGAWSEGTPVSGQKLLIKEAVTLDQANFNEIKFGPSAIDVGNGNQVTIADYTGITFEGKLTIKSGAIRPVEGYTSYALNFDSLVLDGGECELSNPVNPITVNSGTLTISNASKINFSDPNIAARYTINGGKVVFQGSEIQVGGTVFENAIVVASGYTHEDDGVTLTASNTHLVATSAPGSLVYGIWSQNDQARTFFNLVHTGPSGNTYFPAAGYTFMYAALNSEDAAPDMGQIYSTLFSSSCPTIKIDGETLLEGQFSSMFDYSADTAAKTVTVKTFDTIDGTASGAVTLMNGAYVKLAGDVAISTLELAGADSIIDLNGHKLKMDKKGLTVNGTNIETLQDFSSPQIIDTVGTGSIGYRAGGLAIRFR